MVVRGACRPAAYNLLEHNCNHFSDEVAQFLCGARVPKHIVAQPDELLAPPARCALQTLLQDLAPQADRVRLCSLTRLLTHSLAHSLTRSLTHSPIPPYIRVAL